MTDDKHVLSILVDNQPGVLSRIVGLFSGRGYNIDSLCVAETTDPLVSRITISTKANTSVIEQITKQLNKLIDTVKLLDLAEGAHIERELMMIKVKAEKNQREELKRLADIFRANIIDVTDCSYTIEMTGDGSKLDAFIRTLNEDHILETVRSGPLGISRGAKGL